MKHLMQYEGYSVQERIDDILDKISKYGIESLTIIEKEFLDSNSTGKEKEAHEKIGLLENDQVFEDDFGYFKFEYKDTEMFDDEIHYIGTLYVPSIKIGNKKIDGRMDGRIIRYKNGQTILDFEKDDYDVLEFCNGLEYELDSFADYVVEELDKK